MRDLMVFGATSIMLILSIRSVFSAYLVWGWMGLIALNIFVYGFMSGIQYVQIFAIITLTLFLLKRDPKQITFQGNRTSALFAIFGLHALICAILADLICPEIWIYVEICLRHYCIV